MTNERIFVGFSTIGEGRGRRWALHDLELIKRDLLNHFHTRIGERVMRPTYGCSVWDYIGEPLTPSVRDSIRSEVARIIDLDSRLQRRSLKVSSSQHTIIVDISLYYIPFDITETFRIQFDNRQNSL